MVKSSILAAASMATASAALFGGNAGTFMAMNGGTFAGDNTMLPLLMSDRKGSSVPLMMHAQGSRNPMLPLLMHDPYALSKGNNMPLMMMNGAFTGYAGSTGVTQRMLPFLMTAESSDSDDDLLPMMMATQPELIRNNPMLPFMMMDDSDSDDNLPLMMMASQPGFLQGGAQSMLPFMMMDDDSDDNLPLMMMASQPGFFHGGAANSMLPYMMMKDDSDSDDKMLSYMMATDPNFLHSQGPAMPLMLMGNDKSTAEKVPYYMAAAGSRSPMLPLLMHDSSLLEKNGDFLPMAMATGAFTGYPGSTGVTQRMLPFLSGGVDSDDDDMLMMATQPNFFQGGNSMLPYMMMKDDSDSDDDMLSYMMATNPSFLHSQGPAMPLMLMGDDKSVAQKVPYMMAAAGSRSPMLPLLMSDSSLLEKNGDFFPMAMATGAFTGYPGSTGVTQRMLPFIGGGVDSGDEDMLTYSMMSNLPRYGSTRRVVGGNGVYGNRFGATGLYGNRRVISRNGVPVEQVVEP